MEDLLSKKVEPDFAAFKNNILRKATPGRVHYMELYQDIEIKDLVVERFNLDENLDKNDKFYAYKREIALQSFLGYDIVSGALEPQIVFPNRSELASQDTTDDGQARSVRQWADEHSGPIQSWEDFENYPWPDPEKVDLAPLEWAEKNLPENMKIYLPCHAVFEFTSQLFGYENLCYKLFDEPDLVDAVFEKVGQIRIKQAEIFCDFDCVGMLFGGDDFGFKTGLLINKEVLVDKVFPWYKKMSRLVHDKDKIFALHSCGNIETLMDELIDDVELDARQSFENVITPVSEAKKLYGDRLAVIGGMDVDFLCRASHEEIRQRVRDILDVCLPGGGYAMGSGNTVANYIPVDNYLVMLDESRKYTF